MFYNMKATEVWHRPILSLTKWHIICYIGSTACLYCFLVDTLCLSYIYLPVCLCPKTKGGMWFISTVLAQGSPVFNYEPVMSPGLSSVCVACFKESIGSLVQIQQYTLTISGCSMFHRIQYILGPALAIQLDHLRL